MKNALSLRVAGALTAFNHTPKLLPKRRKLATDGAPIYTD
jgi:hypothetical protein